MSAPSKPLHAASAIGAGTPLPLGARLVEGGANFAVVSRHAASARLLVFTAATEVTPHRIIDLEPRRHRSGDVWHVWVPEVRDGWAYAWRIAGPAEAGPTSDQDLLDPRAEAVAVAATAGCAPRAVVVDHRFDWRGDVAPRIPWEETVLYETHVRGFTIHPSSGVARPGTFPGLVEKIPYLKRLGITALELMPVQEFPDPDRSTGVPRRNYWGYDPLAPFAPKAAYGGDGTPQGAIRDFKTMVRALHAVGIEIILDVVLNHTAEGGREGPTFGWRGFDDSIYYLLSPDGTYRDFTGCRNTLNCSHPVVQDYILDCLRHWVVEMHVDGFRLDLAAVLARLSSGTVTAEAPLLERIAEDPILRGVKLIAEPWDATGATIGRGFARHGCGEWNSRFRDDLRRFWRGDPGMIGALATRLCGSADLYQRSVGTPLRSINFVTAHDGFTLYDLTSYRRKHNEANGEDGRDGREDELGDNCGVEGDSTDPAVRRRRLRRMKNLVATLLSSRGVPMLLGGDELCRTQRGNNNAWGQDNEISWYDWRRLASHGEMERFVRSMIAFRRRHEMLRRGCFYALSEILWFGPDGRPTDWSGSDRALGAILTAPPREADRPQPALCLLFNAGDGEVCFAPPPAPPARTWRRFADTGRDSPEDIREDDDGPALAPDAPVVLSGNSMAILVGAVTGTRPGEAAAPSRAGSSLWLSPPVALEERHAAWSVRQQSSSA